MSRQVYAWSGEGIRFDNGVLSFSYLAVATLCVSPSWLKPLNKTGLYLVVGLGVLLAILGRQYSAPPAKTLMIRVFGESLGLVLGIGIGCAMCVLGLLWIWKLFWAAWQEKEDSSRVFLYLNLFALALAPMKVSVQFSSRYLVGALTLLLFIIGPRLRPSRWLAVRVLFGGSLGAGMLMTYYE